MPAKRGRKSYTDDRSRGFEVFISPTLSADRQHSLRSIASLMADRWARNEGGCLRMRRRNIPPCQSLRTVSHP